ncbi:MFS transporter permease [Microbacterium halophytorum]|uniref:MFS transporter permease n=1 Tax=Microbacterium halophytorum TaxID=2067568 RepID=UPI000CFD038B|nr:MFS transporter permease [Microbacterium halophytorum]
MAIRRAFYRWIWLAALVLPAWLLIGWGIFGENGFAILLLLFVAMPSVFVCELLLGLLTRARPSVGTNRAASWLDVAGFGVWHILTAAVVVVPADYLGATLSAAIIAGLGMFWLQFWQLRREAAVITFRASEGSGPADGRDDGPDGGEVFIITENDPKR